jgi:hypothetical protein
MPFTYEIRTTASGKKEFSSHFLPIGSHQPAEPQPGAGHHLFLHSHLQHTQAHGPNN